MAIRDRLGAPFTAFAVTGVLLAIAGLDTCGRVGFTRSPATHIRKKPIGAADQRGLKRRARDVAAVRE
jgi:predicted pyridoxine 5'-phosphate oxidase superfamily flavin-nucleotide-binding protein